jgi:purine-nucleoside phosphorylase
MIKITSILRRNILCGMNDERFGPRFVNMSEPYSRKMIAKAKELANDLISKLKMGIYLGLQGPTFETLAEYNMVKILGADCVGMSTVQRSYCWRVTWI